MNIIRGQELAKWKANAEDNYIDTPISVLKYITVLEEAIQQQKSKAKQQSLKKRCCKEINENANNPRY